MSTIRMEDLPVGTLSGGLLLFCGSGYETGVIIKDKSLIVVDADGKPVDYRIVQKYVNDKQLQNTLAYIRNQAIEECATIADEEAKYQKELADSPNVDFVDGEELATRIATDIRKRIK